MAAPEARDRVNPSAGGARAAGGLTFQAQVFAWWAAHAVSGAAPGLGLDPQVRIEAVGCETGFSVDDVGVALSGGGFILVQAKAGMRRLDPQAQDLRSAIDQLVSAMISGLRADVTLRPVDITRDRLVIATNQDSSQSFRTLGIVCARLRDLPLAVPIDTAAVNENERRALTALLLVVRAAWVAAAGHEPAEGDLRRLLRILEVRRFDFEADAGADLVRCEALLERASVPGPFSVLVGVGIEAARSRTWRQRDALMSAVGLERSAQRGDGSPAENKAHGRSQPVKVLGWLLDEVTDPFALEVHRPVQVDDSPPGLPVLPTYVPREYDRALAAAVQAAAAGRSGIAVLVGGSSTGKTRACWEALGLLRDLPQPWRLWHPIDPSRPEAALHELPSIGPRTVIWLNEAQFYLDAPGGLGERVAAGLREQLRDPDRDPVLVLATLWPQFWDTLTTRPSAGQDDLHAQARELLSGRDITVPAAFTAAQVRMLAGAADPRLAMAAAARDGEVIQFLAGAPELLARYRYAPPAAAALISAAIDGRRLGMGVALPLGFLKAAAPGYLTEDQWDQLDEDWLGQALDYTAADSKGTRGPLTRIRSAPSEDGAPADGALAPDPACRLADYLDQYGRQSRRSIIPPAQFWAAAAIFAAPGDLGVLARAAEGRGLLRDAARLRKRAAAHGDTRAAAALVTSLHSLHPADTDSASWAATYASLDDPGAVAWLLWALQNVGASEQADALLARDPAAHVNVDDPYAVGRLLQALRRAGADDQAKALAARAAAHTSLDDPGAVARLLRILGIRRGIDQAKALAARAAAHTNLDDSRGVVQLLRELREAGVADQAEALLARDPAAHADLDDSRAVARLLRELRESGVNDEVEALAARAAAHTNLDDMHTFARLLETLQEVGVAGQAEALLARDPAAHADLEDPEAVASLLEGLRRVGAADQAEALLARDPGDHANVDDPYAAASLLRALRRAGATGQANVLAARTAAHTNLDDPGAVARLLRNLRRGFLDQARALFTRDLAAHLNVDDPGAVASLLEPLQRVGAPDQAKALAARAAADTNLDDPGAVASLLEALRTVGAADQAKALLARDPAAHANLDAPGAVARLLRALQEAGAVGQAKALTERLPAEGLFDLFYAEANNQQAYRFGREPDGNAAPTWGWDDLD